MASVAPHVVVAFTATTIAAKTRLNNRNSEQPKHQIDPIFNIALTCLYLFMLFGIPYIITRKLYPNQKRNKNVLDRGITTTKDDTYYPTNVKWTKHK